MPCVLSWDWLLMRSAYPRPCISCHKVPSEVLGTGKLSPCCLMCSQDVQGFRWFLVHKFFVHEYLPLLGHFASLHNRKRRLTRCGCGWFCVIMVQCYGLNLHCRLWMAGRVWGSHTCRHQRTVECNPYRRLQLGEFLDKDDLHRLQLRMMAEGMLVSTHWCRRQRCERSHWNYKNWDKVLVKIL